MYEYDQKRYQRYVSRQDGALAKLWNSYFHIWDWFCVIFFNVANFEPFQNSFQIENLAKSYAKNWIKAIIHKQANSMR